MPAQSAAIYARQSNTREGSESLALQVDACLDVAARFDVTVAHKLVEPPSTSAYKNRGKSRPQFLELVQLVRAGEVDAVVCYKTDRLSRGGGVGWAPLIEAIEDAGLDPNRFVLTPNGWVPEWELTLRAAIDREEANKIAERMRDVRAREARQGRPRPGITRGYGYDRKGVSVLDTEAARIREAAERVMAGETVYSIVQDWNRQRVPTVTGALWKSNVLKRLLQSPRIAGLREHHGVVVADGQWPAIISRDEHDRLVALLAPRPGRRAKTAPRTYPLVGFLRCGKCGTPLRSLARDGGRRSYACRAGDGLGGCGGIRIKAEWVEDAVAGYVIAALTDPALREPLLAALPQPDNTDQLDLLDGLRRLDLQRQRLTDLAVEGVISAQEVRRKNDELDDQVARLQQRLAAVPAMRVATDLPTTFEQLADAWKVRGIDYQRTLIALTIDHITVTPAARPGRRGFDPERLRWSLRA